MNSTKPEIDTQETQTIERKEPTGGEIAIMTLKLLAIGAAIGLVIYGVEKFL